MCNRIGRTGRAGASGEAISLACLDEEVFLKDIERLIQAQHPAAKWCPASNRQPANAPSRSCWGA